MQRFCACLLLCLALLLCACEGQPAVSPEVPVTAEPVISAAETEEVTEPVCEGPFDPLTGLPCESDLSAFRSVAVVLNNLKEALPMQGNGDAAILYEVLAEGGITRLLGVYSSLENVGTLGSIRSARPYFIELALGHDALFVHAGGSDDAYTDLRDWHADHMDGVNGGYSSASAGVYYRDQNRLGGCFKYEHSLLSSGERIQKAWEASRMPTEHREGYENPLIFTDAPLSGGENAKEIRMTYSPYKSGSFVYDAANGLYAVEEYGAPFIDGNTGEQITVKNVLVLSVKYTYSGDEKGHMYADLTKGEGYYAADGVILPIRWEKGKRDAPLRYFTGDGEPLALCAGKSYVNLLPTTGSVEWE